MSKEREGQISGIIKRVVTIATQTATAATQNMALWQAPHDVKIVKVNVRSNAAITGDNTNRINLNLIDSGTAGSGTDEIANVDFTTSTDVAAGGQVTLTPTSEYALGEGKLLKLQTEKVGTGGSFSGLAEIHYRNV